MIRYVGDERNTLQIKVWMLANQITAKRLAHIINLDPVNVSLTLNKKRNNRRVLRKLVELGCPVEYLDLPTDMLS